MNNFLRKSTGLAAITIVIIVIVAIIAGGATVLAVRMLVTGEDYLAPFEELGWISSDEEEKDSDEESKSNEAKEEAKEITTLQDPSRLSEESKKPGTIQYYGSVTSAEMSGYDTTDEYYDLYNSLELEVNLFASDDKATEIVFHMDIGKALEVMYEEYGDEIAASGEEYANYQEFEDEYLPYFEEMMESMLVSDEEMAQYVDMYMEDGVLEMYVTEDGFDSLYEEYSIDPDSENVQDFIDAIEEGLGVTLEEV